jgi:hypothetical protein
LRLLLGHCGLCDHETLNPFRGGRGLVAYTERQGLLAGQLKAQSEPGCCVCSSVRGKAAVYAMPARSERTSHGYQFENLEHGKPH